MLFNFLISALVAQSEGFSQISSLNTKQNNNKEIILILFGIEYLNQLIIIYCFLTNHNPSLSIDTSIYITYVKKIDFKVTGNCANIPSNIKG